MVWTGSRRFKRLITVGINLVQVDAIVEIIKSSGTCVTLVQKNVKGAYLVHGKSTVVTETLISTCDIIYKENGSLCSVQLCETQLASVKPI